jgi:putative FmdB family regulatory protein
MPIYEYQCLRCSERLETMQRWSDPPPAECPKCGGELKKLVSAPAFQFKGTGWYVTDYAKKDAGGDAGKSSDGKSDDGGGGGGDESGAGKADKSTAKTPGKTSGESSSSSPSSASPPSSSSTAKSGSAKD